MKNILVVLIFVLLAASSTYSETIKKVEELEKKIESLKKIANL